MDGNKRHQVELWSQQPTRDGARTATVREYKISKYACSVYFYASCQGRMQRIPREIKQKPNDLLTCEIVLLRGHIISIAARYLAKVIEGVRASVSTSKTRQGKRAGIWEHRRQDRVCFPPVGSDSHEIVNM